MCQLGPASDYEQHLFAVGDSHNNTLIGAYESTAETYNWRIDVTGHAGCYWTTAAQESESSAHSASCREWRTGVDRYLAETPDLDGIVVTHVAAAAPVIRVDGESQFETVVRGQVEAWGSRPDLDVPILALVDNPRTTLAALECVETLGAGTYDRCRVPRSRALSSLDGQSEAVAIAHNAHLIDLTQWYCDDQTCPQVVGNVLVYRDTHHITATYAATLAPYLGQELAKVVGR